jgi:hypothetical protein
VDFSLPPPSKFYQELVLNLGDCEDLLRLKYVPAKNRLLKLKFMPESQRNFRTIFELQTPHLRRIYPFNQPECVINPFNENGFGII